MTTNPHPSDPANLDALLRQALKSQYRSALAMLREAVEHCPDALWVAGRPPFWQVTYHAAFFADYYMQANDAAFVPWKLHRPKMESLADPPVPLGEPYTRSELLDYVSQCQAMVGSAVDALDLASPDAGFSWYKVSKVEHQIINIRHIQHHAVYLSAALKSAGAQPVKWISPGETDKGE